ncbi:DUF6519 domain-containing protein [Corallococcus exiguus]|uniref:Uncharacterized protein n=1 Tax=Corallococcus exiguus TaxID=83462 RepID=A0A7X5BW30_9BACT|nr:DUF6519 domain-containing protein [Corallococcus exiguus]NBC43828.1 hypothetical protein [Corallococcus exiguus]TNV53978.1 hypothetical protein FH620_34175 [Corallococcus exiguus]
MKTQISRDSHDSSKGYSGVYQQQGRMLTDADWNELVSIINDRVTSALRDVVGSGGPATGKLLISNTLQMTPGSVYADGLMASLPGTTPFTYATQPDFPLAPGAPAVGESLYADVWERPVLFLEDPNLQDPGLHGADTSTRTQVMLQIKRCPAGQQPTDPLVNPGRGNAPLTLSQRVAGTGPAAQFTGNYLFRLEVHDVKGSPTAPSELTLKWSSENAAEAYANGPGVPQDYQGNDWLYEFYNAATERHLGVHLGTPPAGFPSRGLLKEGYPVSVPDAATYPFVRRWDGWCTLTRNTTTGVWTFVSGGRDRGAPLSTANAQGVHGHVRIESGVLHLELQDLALALTLTAGGTTSRAFVAGDYWLAPVREQDAAGDQVLSGAQPVGLLHRYVKLGVIASGVFTPERTLGFPSLTRLMSPSVGDSGANYVGTEAHADVTGTTVQSQLSSLIPVLNKANSAANGSGLIGSAAITGTPKNLPAGTVRSQLTQLVTHVNTHVASTSTDHDARYYPRTEANAAFASTSHLHDAKYPSILYQWAFTLGPDESWAAAVPLFTQPPLIAMGLKLQIPQGDEDDIYFAFNGPIHSQIEVELYPGASSSNELYVRNTSIETVDVQLRLFDVR